MKTIVRFVVVAIVLSFGSSAFMPSVFGCSGTGMSGCKTVTGAPLVLAVVRSVVSVWDVLAP
jgi:hypothetical protein